MTTSDDLPKHVEEALKGVLHGSLDGRLQVIQYHVKTPCDAEEAHRLAVIQIQQGDNYGTRYYQNRINSRNFQRTSEDTAKEYFRGHVCNPDACYRRA